ncbi:unnamed protein product [Polarella glacialis]|uniref:Uncharacterized protein n=1 Tax=Polarella glacialis TaxID=89957 RepID=A0A813FM56_POLGL|nr:unnamed protein product [Polarella glacialis]
MRLLLLSSSLLWLLLLSVHDLKVCNTDFSSRNRLFRHLRENPGCAKEGGFAAVAAEESERVNAISETPAPADPTPAWDPTAAAKKVKDRAEKKTAERKPPQVETRAGSYKAELQAKVQALEAFFVDGAGLAASFVGLPPTEVFESPPEHFRMKAEFGIWNHDGGPSYAMSSGKSQIVVDRYPMGSRVMCDTLMPAVLEAIRAEELLRAHLFQVNFHTTLRGGSIVSLLYHTPYDRGSRRERNRIQAENRLAEAPTLEGDTKGPLTDDWEAAAVRLQAAIAIGDPAGASIVGRIHGMARVVGHDWVEEELEVVGVPKRLRYRQLGGFFCQPNAAVCQHMLAWARAVCLADAAEIGTVVEASREDDLLELYCGNGNFAVALAPCFRRVLATELVKALVDTAKLNAEYNDATNVAFARVSAEELAQAMQGTRVFERMKHISLEEYRLNTVLVDPPRAGLGPEVCALLAQFPRIVYISCNPETLRVDFEMLRETHGIQRMAAFDQFPYTDHVEMGVLLVRRAT